MSGGAPPHLFTFRRGLTLVRQWKRGRRGRREERGKKRGGGGGTEGHCMMKQAQTEC